MTRSFKMTIAGVAAATLAAPAAAVDIKAGDWTVSIGGIVNAYVTRNSCTGSQAIGGLALATEALGCGGLEDRTVIGNGLLPNALITSVKTKQEGVDIGALIMIGSAVSSNDSISNNNNLDVRQGYLTFGTPELGTLKLGRDYGLYSQTATLADMTLLGVGAPISATQRNRVSLGHIGAGYTYLGHYGQIMYTTPSLGGLTVSAGVMSPVDSFANVFTAGTAPQFQALATFAFTGGKVWAGGKVQKFDGPSAANPGFTMRGVDAGATYALGPIGLLANVQIGRGLGILADGDSGGKKQFNYLTQATYQLTSKAKAGVGWGKSRLRDGAGTDLRYNSDITGGLYYSLTKSLTLAAELSQTRSKDFVGDSAKVKAGSLGAILFF